jgi:general secretion pathway protein K
MTDDARQLTHETEARAWRWGYVSADELRPLRAQGRAKRSSSAQPTRDGSERHQRARKPATGRRGVALVVVITAIAILSVFVADLIENTATDFHVAESERDRVKAEYLAKSGCNLLRLLIGHEPEIRRMVAPFYQMLVGRAPPQLNVWDFADNLLAPFADYKNASASSMETGIDFSLMKGVKDTGGRFEVLTVPENSKINLSKPLFFNGDQAKTSTAMQLFALMDGLTMESPYDAMFSARDPDGHFTTRLDIISAVIDWWDPDDQRTAYDPGSRTTASGGSEDDIYRQFPDPYMIKNAPFDSLEELRLIRGVGDDFWASFIESESGDPRQRKVTIYGSGAVNVNMATPEVLLARLCSYLADQPLCRDPAQMLSFIQLFRTARSILPIALFSTPQDFFNFISAKPNAGLDLYTALSGFLKGSPLMAWTPFVIPPEIQNQLNGVFLTEGSIFTLQSTGTVGRTQAKINMVINTDRLWTPPRGVSGTMPALGVVHYYRLN